VKNTIFFKVVKNTMIFQSGLVVMDDLPRWKIQRFFKEVKNATIFQSGLVVMDDLPRWKTWRFFKVVKNAEIFQSSLVVMSDLPRWNNEERVFKEVWLWWVTYPGEMKCLEETTW
jgi:hypothetical protein